jgi:hypothetical protein
MNPGMNDSLPSGMAPITLGSLNFKPHENQTNITMRPLHADLELLYFSAQILTKYLTTLNNGKF